MHREQSSYRDPAGFVLRDGNKIYRAITEYGLPAYQTVKQTGLFTDLMEQGLLVNTRKVTINSQFECPNEENIALLLEHEPISYISYPFEWSFSLLKKAALFHLDILINSLEYNVTLSDASAYNVQFKGTQPIFIDFLSFQPYNDGQYWLGYQQFCEHFLIPLLLHTKTDLAYNAMYRGKIEGISRKDAIALLPFHCRFSLNSQAHIYLPEFLQRRAQSMKTKTIGHTVKQHKLAKNSYLQMLKNLARWVNKLKAKHNKQTTWGNYENDNSYSDDTKQKKCDFIAEFIQSTEPKQLFDLGCNTGEYAIHAIESGCYEVIGFDTCHTALAKAFDKAEQNQKRFLPLYCDICNPSPDLGWDQKERQGFLARAKPDALLALALIHHLRIGKNIPLKSIVNWLVKCAPTGVIEFVPKSDPMVQRMCVFRANIFDDYEQENFENILSQRARVIKKKSLKHQGRCLYWYTR